MHRFMLASVLSCCTLLVACSPAEESPRGFSLPVGNAEHGKATFIALQCNACHSTNDVEQVAAAAAGAIAVKLGGEVGHVKTYAHLVTSIINPSHRLAPGYPAEMVALLDESRMRNYNDAMTVTQLIDLVTYLQPQYKLRVYEPTMYRGYHP